MKKVVVIGSGGAGKSAFSQKLGEITGLPVVHLDRLFWRPGWVGRPPGEWTETLRHELKKPEWIMDGNFGATREMRMRAADTVILLDLPRWLCTWRIIKRLIRYHGRTRPDLGDGCNERFDPEFIAWVWTYPNGSRRRAMAELESLSGKEIIILKSRNEVATFLEQTGR